MPQFVPAKGTGKANSKNVVLAGKARFTVLSQGLIRLEYAENGSFEDRASWFAARRNVEVQNFTQSVSNNVLQIETERLTLTYQVGSGPFSAANLSITVAAGDGRKAAHWKPGMAPTGNLGGTIRTLDEVEGPRDLGLGILSRDGWAFIDDSETVLFTDEEFPWADARPKHGNLDWYFFGYQLDYKAALVDLTTLGGKIPLPPKFALGSWYSRYWPYTSEEFLQIADEYKAKGFPLDVMVIDMDWHEDGWTGYTWNKKIIPDPKALLKELHAKGLKVTLNLHPHDGVGNHEGSHQEFVKAMGLPEGSMDAVPFDITDRKFAESYFRVLLNPMEGDGVDFWWMDWQQGSKTKIEGVDPLMWLNYLHFRDRQRPVSGGSSSSLRGMNFSRWAGLGDHRHPVHFSGDTHSNWEVLEFLAPFTATAGNVGAAYWSHDIGGHFATAGRTDPELFTRWIQFGAFSPVLRVHSSRDKDSDRRPWLDGEPFASAIRDVYQLRDQLSPYLYGAARQCFDTGLAPLRPMYLAYPQEQVAYEAPNQFMFGDDVLVAPAARPGFGKARVAHVAVWFPAGDWYDLMSHQRFQGPLHTSVALGLEGVAAFARGGAPIPMKGDKIRLYPGPATSRQVYEDDGETSDYQEGTYRQTLTATRQTAEGFDLSVGPSIGDYQGASKSRPEISVEFPAGQAKSAQLKAGKLNDVSHALLKASYSGDAADRFYKARLQLQKAKLALRQLTVAHESYAALDGLCWRFEQLLELAADQAAFEKELGAISQERDGLMKKLAASKADGSQEALWVLAGVSALALAKPSADPSKIIIEIEVRREEAVAVACEISISAGNKAGAQIENKKLGVEALSVLHFEWAVDFGSTAAVSGEVLLSLKAGGMDLTLRAPFSWSAGTVREWLVLGPLPEGTLSAKQISEAIEAEIAYPKLGGGETRFQPRRFDPAGVMRSIREFYDFKETFHCPKGECLAQSILLAEKAGEVEFGFGHEGKAQIWINGMLMAPENGKFKASLKAGENQVSVKISNMIRVGGGFGLSVKRSGCAIRFKAPELTAAKASAGIS